MRDAVVQHLGETERSADTGSEMAVGLLVLAVGFGCWFWAVGFGLLAVQRSLQGRSAAEPCGITVAVGCWSEGEAGATNTGAAPLSSTHKGKRVCRHCAETEPERSGGEVDDGRTGATPEEPGPARLRAAEGSE